MLVLTRKLGESIRIGDNVELYVVGVSRGRVRLGFKAPQNVIVQRSEVPIRLLQPAPVGEPVPKFAPTLSRPQMATAASQPALATVSGV